MYQCELSYNNQTEILPLNKMTFFEDLYVDFKSEDIPVDQLQKGIKKGTRFQLTIHPKKDVKLKNVLLTGPISYNSSSNVFCNGFQSWTESRIFSFQESIPDLRGIAKPLMGYYGDYHIKNIQRKKGYLHSWTYSYIQQAKGIQFFGSLNEKTAFTLIQHDSKENKIAIQKDCEGLDLKHSFPILDFVIFEGDEQAIFEQYFQMMDCPPPKAKAAIGWTSWYHYYTDISEKIILDNLAEFKKVQQEMSTLSDNSKDIIFQIDDGFCTVGDWLKIDPSFPNGMGAVARQIKDKGFKAGLWLAPFICTKSSFIFQQNPAWLLKDLAGKPIKVGYNPLWDGWYYALDFYNPGVQEYLTKVLLTVVEKWGYDMVKLDFLFAVCLAPPPSKTRAQVMHDAMLFLRNMIGNKLILGCGVPLASSFGLVDYCRIGADIHLKWEHPLLKFFRHRERVSTIVALRTVLGRWQLNNRAFVNDPDVFILRKEKNKLTPTQQYTILIINTLLGNLLFTSDFLGDYSEEQWSEYLSILKWGDSSIKNVLTMPNDLYEIHFSNNGNDFVALCNLSGKKQSHSKVNLEEYETMILKI